MNNKMLALYGLKWNPFTPNVPTEALHVTARLESFCWRVQQLAGDGGFALVTGAPGCGKSAALRILSASLATQRDVTVGVISRPQANIADFYREMGELFGVELRPHNRFAAWDLTVVHLVDPHTGTVLCRLFPQDKAANASGQRRGLQPIDTETAKPSSSPQRSLPPPARGIGPLLERMLDRQSATGLPPAYLPKDEGDDV